MFVRKPVHIFVEDEIGVTQHLTRGGRGEVRHPLFALGQHSSLVAIQGRLRVNEHVHDDVHTVCKRARVAGVRGVVEEELLTHAHIQLHHGKAQVWNRA